jgi:hypothetical protein
MYVIRTKLKDNVFLRDLGITVSWNDADGVLIDNRRFNDSKDAQVALKKGQIYIDRPDGDFSQSPDKNVIGTEDDLNKITKPYEDMTVYIENYKNTNEIAIAMFTNGKWEILTSGLGLEENISAGSIIQDESHRFVTDQQIIQWEAKSGFDGDYNKLYNKPTIPTLPTLASVATTGSYNDLSDQPALKQVAVSGSYNDLSDKPVIATGEKVGIFGLLSKSL